MNDAPRSLHDFRLAEIEDVLRTDGLNPHHAKALWRAIQREGELDLEARDFVAPLKRWVEANVGAGKAFFLDAPEVVETIHSGDGLTRKYLLRLADGQTIETVLMGYDGRQTVCVSTQAGCAMGCVFCATGQMGFVRHLRPGEIVAQVQHVRRVLRADGKGKRLRNIVLMGMGEPLHNYEAVIRSMDIVSDVRGASIGPSRIAISTVGVIPNILRLAEEKQPYRLAVSLHGATEEERASLVPVSKKWSLGELVEACRTYGRITGKRIFFGWTLIAGKNDSPDQARKLVELLKGIDGHMNLIPLNATNGYAGTPAAQAAAFEFQRILQEAGFPCTFRQRRGIDVAAGCGMLQAEKKARVVRLASDTGP